MVAQFRQRILLGGAVVLVSALAACAPKAPPPPPPPPPSKPVAYVPPRPQPPLGAPSGLVVPRVGADGVRQTVNHNLIPAQATWNFRSAYNVAALNCLKPEHANILIGYRAFLKTHGRGLTSANRGVDSDFRKRYGAAFIRPRESYMTQVYNYFAYPPTLASFCDATLAVSRGSATVKPAELADFSARSLAQIEVVFEQFYRSYEQYRADAALWDAKYAPSSVAPATPASTAPSVK
jgi:hypothetical protein